MIKVFASILICIGTLVGSNAFKFQKLGRPSSNGVSPVHSSNIDISKVCVALKSVIPSFLVAATLMTTPIPSHAAVGEGDLPAGPLAQAKILKLKDDWAQLSDVIKQRKNDLTNDEIFSTKVFMKQLANEYEDLIFLSNSIADSDKQAKALSFAKDLRTLMRECDRAATNREFDYIIETYPKTAADLNGFFAQMQDIPDEL